MAGTAKRGDQRAPAGKDVSGVGSGAEPKPGEPGLDRVIQAQIGDKLRSMYGELVEQPVPDRLASLLDQLARQPPGR